MGGAGADVDPVALARELIAEETVSPVRTPAPFDPIRERLADRGIDPTVHEFDGVHGLTASFGPAPRFCLNGHLDVVAPGEGWTVTGPFDPVVRDGRLYGRGASDMKAALAAEVAAFCDLHADPDYDAGAVLMVAGDEEVGGERGTARLVERFPTVERAVVGEPTDLDVQVGTRGTLWLDVRLEGEPVHASRPTEGRNAVADLPAVLDALLDLDLAYEPDDVLPAPTTAVTVVETDDTQNSVPGRARVGLDVRYVPSQTVAGIVAAVRTALDATGVDYRLETTDHGGPYTLEDEAFLAAATGALEAVRDDPVRHVAEGGASDGRFFAARGVPFVEIGVGADPAHRPDEHCAVADVRRLRRVYADVLRRLAPDS